MPRLPEHPVLAAVAGHLKRHRWAGYIAGASEKAIRDAGGIAVAAL